MPTRNKKIAKRLDLAMRPELNRVENANPIVKNGQKSCPDGIGRCRPLPRFQFVRDKIWAPRLIADRGASLVRLIIKIT